MRKKISSDLRCVYMCVSALVVLIHQEGRDFDVSREAVNEKRIPLIASLDESNPRHQAHYRLRRTKILVLTYVCICAFTSLVVLIHQEGQHFLHQE